MKYSKDYYKIIGVAENASAEDIKKEYRKLAIRYHPDKNKGNKQAEEKFKEISEAYYVLSDPKRRAEFDQFRKFGGVDPRNGGGGGGGFRGAEGFDFEDLLRSYGGGRGRSANRSQSYSGFADIFEELFSGGGSGSFDFGSGSRGETRQAVENFDHHGTIKLTAERARMGGAVKIRSKDGKMLSVTIPKNAKDGIKLRLVGLGKLSRTGKRGDLILQLKVVS